MWNRVLFRLKSLTRWVLLALAGLSTASAAPVDYQVEEMADGIYRFTAGNYRSLFMITDEGAFVTDPIDEGAARWLKSEIETRFEVGIRYVAYSHNHYDHAQGGQGFDGPGTTFIAHRLAREDMLRTRLDTRYPDLVFDRSMAVHLGDATVDLTYHGVNNGRGSVSMLFQPSKTLYVVDWIVLGRMPYRDLQGYDIQGMIDSTREVLKMDFDRIVCGHAAAGSKADVERYLGYLEKLYAAVLDGMLAGKSLEQLQSEIRLPEYSDWKMYEEWLPLNVAGVYRTLNDVSYIDLRMEAN